MSRKQQEASIISPFVYIEIGDDDEFPNSGQTTPRGPSPPLSDTQSYVTALESPDFSVVGSDRGSDSTEEYTSAKENLTNLISVNSIGGIITADTSAPVITFSSPSPPQPPSTERSELDEESSSTSPPMPMQSIPSRFNQGGLHLPRKNSFPSFLRKGLRLRFSLSLQTLQQLEMTGFTPLTRSVTERSTGFDGFQNLENGLQHQLPSVEDDVEEELYPYGHEDEDFGIRPLSEYEMALTGANVIADPESSPKHTISAARGMEPEVIRLPIINRRAHAIPIRAPPSPRSRRKVSLPAFQHGLVGIPSHYIPLQGALIGMFFDPLTSMYVGDGPPRSTPRRSDGTAPTTITREQFNIETAPVNIDDMVHVQSLDQINSIEDEADERAAINPQPGQVPFDLSYTPTSVPTCPYEAYWCSCRQTWLSYSHDCPEPPTPAFPTSMPIRPGTELPADWITHRIVVDSSVYPGKVGPKETLAATATNSAVGGEHGSELPVRWFAPGPVGFDVGSMAEVLRVEAAESEAAYDDIVCSTNSKVCSTAHFPAIPNTQPSNNAIYPPTNGIYILNPKARLAATVSQHNDDSRSGSETEVPKKRNRRNKRTGHRGKADKHQASAEKNDETKLPVVDGNHEMRGEVKGKQPEPSGLGKELPTKEDSSTVSHVEKRKQPGPQGKAKEPAKIDEKLDEDVRLDKVGQGIRLKPKINLAGLANSRTTTENDKADVDEIKRVKGPEPATILPTTNDSYRNNRSTVATPREVRAIIASATAKQPPKHQQTWSAIAQSQSLKKPTPAGPVAGKKTQDPLNGAGADANKSPEKKGSGESDWTEVVSSATKKALRSGRRGGKDSGKPNPKGPKRG